MRFEKNTEPEKNTQHRADLFRGVFKVMLDYYGDHLDRCTKWGLDTFELLEKSGRMIGATTAGDKGYFIYAVTLAHIVGQFSDRAFGDHNCDDSAANFEKEFDIEQLGLHFKDVECYLNEDISEERREELRIGNYITLSDIWAAMWEWTAEIYGSLSLSYMKDAKEGVDTDLLIYLSLMRIFETVDDDGDTVSPTCDQSQQLAAYTYVSGRFQY